MSTFTRIGTVIVWCTVVATCLSQSAQGGHESQGGVHKLQEGVHESQGRVHVSQGGVHVSQGGVHESQEGVHESQGSVQQSQRVRRQAPQVPVDWVTCDFTAPTKISCQDCNTRVICKPIGGFLKPCSPKKPFCSNGVCSAVPSEECA